MVQALDPDMELAACPFFWGDGLLDLRLPAVLGLPRFWQQDMVVFLNKPNIDPNIL